MNKNGVIHSTLIRSIAELLVPSNKCQFRLREYPDSDFWNDCVMNGEKATLNDDKLVFINRDKNFTLRGGVLNLVTDYKFNTDSPDTKLIIDSLDEMHFDIHARGKSFRRVRGKSSR